MRDCLHIDVEKTTSMLLLKKTANLEQLHQRVADLLLLIMFE